MNCLEESLKQYSLWITSDSRAAIWVSGYLNYNHQQAAISTIQRDVSSVDQAFKNWLKRPNEAVGRRVAAWQNYREKMIELPDDKETMFAENFGVRKVFVQPLASYKVAGMKRDTGVIVPDVANLLATLLSDRTNGEDLIVLCGGPGSGKSTLCRILASQLAHNDQVNPVFLRLRRLQDGQDIVAFMEDQLQKEGVIDKITDLSEVQNLVIILDGFDELVMASRARLREFFRGLKDDMASAPLRKAKAIVSGRDTLFPNGQGLPTGAHVVSLLPFDKKRIEAWGQKWRELHPGKKMAKFMPENFISEHAESKGRSIPPLHHLVSWPLTLHLVARAHTSGSINLGAAKSSQIEKAILYRSIVTDTALRQENQSAGKGRLGPKEMRSFVQALSWEMYSSGRDALDYNEGLPVLKSIFPTATENELAELSDVAIVNQPELTKGEQGGFEFVHKSFSEYFVAERLATGLEQICFKVQSWGNSEPTWRMSIKEATREMASLVGIRFLTPEVQEMLEPMLDDFAAFLNDAGLPATTPNLSGVKAKLFEKKERIKSLIEKFCGGGLSLEISEATRSSKLICGDLEAQSNYVAGLLILGCAISRRFNSEVNDREKSLQISVTHLLKLVHIVSAGEIIIDQDLADRGLTGIDVAPSGQNTEIYYPPIPPILFSGVNGLDFSLEQAISSLVSQLRSTQLELMINNFIEVIEQRTMDHSEQHSYYFNDYARRWRHSGDALEMLEVSSRKRSRIHMRDSYELMEMVKHRLRRLSTMRLGDEGPNKLSMRTEGIHRELERLLHEFEYSFGRVEEQELFHRLEYVLHRAMRG